MPPLSSPGGVATLGEIGDVDLSGLEDGEGIEFDSASSTWLAGLPDGEFYQLGGNAASGNAGDYAPGTVTNSPEGVTGSTRNDIWWDQSGLRVYTYRGPSPRIDQYDVFPAWSVNPGPPSDWTSVGTLINQVILTVNGGLCQLLPDGTGFLHAFSSGGNAFIRVFDLAIPFDITSSALAPSSAISFIGTSGGASKWTPLGDAVFVLLNGINIIRKINLASPFDLSVNVAVFDFDFFSDSASINGWVLSADGLFLYASRNSDKRLVSWEFAVPFDMSSVIAFDGTNGPLLNAGSNFFVPQGFNFRADNGDLIMGDSLKSGSANQRMQVLSL